MKKVRYYYNTHTSKYEKLVVPLRTKILRVLGFISTAIVTSVIIVSIAYRFVSSPGEKRLRQELMEMQEAYDALNARMNAAGAELGELEKRDDNIYRTIFEAHPLPDSAREKELASAKEYRQLQNYADNELVMNAAATLSKMEYRIRVENTSYNEIDKLIKNKQKMLACIPAIQPVSNRDLSRLASGFGYRIDPIYKTVKFHPGLDFAAPIGTPVYATGNGTVEFSGFDDSGYGNHVILNHGYGYESLYGHLVKVKVHRGQQVKRGQVIGWVGSTGKSTGPHCHYEVIKNGEKMDPVYFFYNDLSPQQYERMLKLAASGNQSLD